MYCVFRYKSRSVVLPRTKIHDYACPLVLGCATGRYSEAKNASRAPTCASRYAAPALRCASRYGKPCVWPGLRIKRLPCSIVLPGTVAVASGCASRYVCSLSGCASRYNRGGVGAVLPGLLLRSAVLPSTAKMCARRNEFPRSISASVQTRGVPASAKALRKDVNTAAVNSCPVCASPYTHPCRNSSKKRSSTGEVAPEFLAPLTGCVRC